MVKWRSFRGGIKFEGGEQLAGGVQLEDVMQLVGGAIFFNPISLYTVYKGVLWKWSSNRGFMVYELD